MEFQFTGKARITAIALMAIGLIMMIAGYFTGHGDHHEVTNRFWSNLLISGFFFFAISLGALYFLALQYAAEVAWSVAVKRVFEALMAFMPFGAGILILVMLAGQFHLHHIWHWMDPEVYIEGGEHYDPIIAGKWAYFNPAFFWGRQIAYFAVWWYFMWWYRKKSLEQDSIGGTGIHFKSFAKGGAFLAFFAVTSSSSAWDWFMSIDTHWFSTMYGWYVFSGLWCTTMVTALALTIWLKNKGYLEWVNQSHIHDLAKWVFALSFLWSYIWFCQFMLIWYSNIPEEVTYFLERWNHYGLLHFATFFVNFAFPMLILMSRDAKRNVIFILPVLLIIFIGHWFDVYGIVTPGVMHEKGAQLGMLEIGTFLCFLGLFVFVVFRALAKAPLLVKNHPFLDETLHHHV